jgi:hypothetical protein
MDQYDLQLAGSAVAQYDALLTRAAAAGKQEEFERRYGEIFRVISDPRSAVQIGRPLGQTVLPGGFYRAWQWHFLYVRYALFPDEGCGWIYQIEFNPPSWA